MITHAQARKYLFPGDEVFIHDGGVVKALPIKRINADSLTVEGGFLDFDTCGTEWFLTKLVAKEKLKKEKICENSINRKR